MLRVCDRCKDVPDTDQDGASGLLACMKLGHFVLIGHTLVIFFVPLHMSAWCV